jgi:hypothetical protein
LAQAATHNRLHNSKETIKVLKNPLFISRFLPTLQGFFEKDLYSEGNFSRMGCQAPAYTNQARRWPAGPEPDLLIALLPRIVIIEVLKRSMLFHSRFPPGLICCG